MKLFPGCTVTSRIPFVESATMFIAERLGEEFSGKESMCCFEPTGLKSVDYDVWTAVGEMIHSRNADERIVTLCEGCNMSLTLSQGILETEEGISGAEKRLSEAGMKPGRAEINGLLEYLHENIDGIRKFAEKPIEGIGAVFPGCHGDYAYMKRDRNASEMLYEIMEAAGCSGVKVKESLCCGGGLQGVHDDIAGDIISDMVNTFKEAGADFAVVSCGFCLRRIDAAAKFPVMHISELVARSMGWDTDVSRYHKTEIQSRSSEN